MKKNSKNILVTLVNEKNITTEERGFLQRVISPDEENTDNLDSSNNLDENDITDDKRGFLQRVISHDEEATNTQTSDVEFSDEETTSTQTSDVEFSNEDSSDDSRGFLQRLLSSDDENAELEENSESEEENLTYSLVKRITDDMLIEIYGKVFYPDNDTVAATTPYVAYGTNGNKTVFQLNENGCFDEVNEYKFNGDEVSIITDRDFPLIVGRSKEYSDVRYSWNDEDIKFISSFDIMPGQGGNFNPSKNVTRGDFIEALYNLAGKPEYNINMNYSDVSEGSRYYDSVNWAYEQGLIKGRSDEEFGVSLNVTREQAAVVLSKYVEKMGFQLSSAQKNYSDVQNISSWAIDDVYKISNTGIMTDLGYGRFQPKTFCSRAEIATLLKKVIQYKINF